MDVGAGTGSYKPGGTGLTPTLSVILSSMGQVAGLVPGAPVDFGQLNHPRAVVLRGVLMRKG